MGGARAFLGVRLLAHPALKQGFGEGGGTAPMVEKSPDSAAPRLWGTLTSGEQSCPVGPAEGGASSLHRPLGHPARDMCTRAPRCPHVARLDGPDSLSGSLTWVPRHRDGPGKCRAVTGLILTDTLCFKACRFLSGGSGKEQAHLSAVMPGRQWPHWPDRLSVLLLRTDRALCLEQPRHTSSWGPSVSSLQAMSACCSSISYSVSLSQPLGKLNTY